VIWPSFGSAGLESVTSAAKNNGASLVTWLILVQRISHAVLEIDWITLSIANF
jgi:hypothetical protein